MEESILSTVKKQYEGEREICFLDSVPEKHYTQQDVERIVSERLREERILARQRYERRMLQRTNLENGIEQAEMVMSLQKGRRNMHRRQRITINGSTQWRSFESIQDLVDIVVTTVKEELMARPERKHVLFKDYISEWFHTYKATQLGDGYRINYLTMMNKHIIPAIGDKDVSEISVADVQQIMNTLHAASTAKQVKCIINMVMDAAIADELYHHPNPTRDKRIVMPTAQKKREGLSKENLSKIMELLPTMPEEYSCILAMLLMTGARRGEALGARWEDIDWDAKTIHLQRVVRFINNRPVVSDKMKTKAANRIVSIWDGLIPFLGIRKESGFIIHCNGEPLSERQYRTRWKGIMRYLQAEGIEECFTAHQLRHTYATVAANSGNIPPKVLQGMLGHANFQTTMNIYAGLDADKVRESSQNLSGEYAKITGKSCREIAAK